MLPKAWWRCSVRTETTCVSSSSLRVSSTSSGPLVVIYSALVIDAVGIGLIFPILPALLRDVTSVDNVAPYLGVMAALYAVMQFVFAPMLGALSDRLGRRPVLLISMAGAAVNYLFLAFAPSLWMLLVGRALAGLTSANASVATAYITDVTSEEQRARRFGLLGATFGIGFAIGPVLGGALGEHWLRLPFIAAALLNTGNFLLAFFKLPESRLPTGPKINLAALNPLLSLRWVLSEKRLWPTASAFFVFSASGEAYGSCWALWGGDTFHWERAVDRFVARHLRCLPDAGSSVPYPDRQPSCSVSERPFWWASPVHASP